MLITSFTSWPNSFVLPTVITINIIKRRHVDFPSLSVPIAIGIFKSQRYKPLLPYCNQANRWIRETFHGLSQRQLQVYFDEFCFRINMGWKGASVFVSLIGLCTEHEKILYLDLVQR